MSDINERLMDAAAKGSEAELKALIREPGCDALVKSRAGMTALMWAAYRGHEACVKILLPMSDVLTKNGGDSTASECARRVGHESLAQFIEAYALAQSEKISIEAVGLSGAPRGQARLRV